MIWIIWIIFKIYPSRYELIFLCFQWRTENLRKKKCSKCLRKLGEQIIILITFPWINIVPKFAKMTQARNTRIICIQMRISLGSWFYFYITTINREFQSSTPLLFPSKEKEQENEKLKHVLGIQIASQVSVHQLYRGVEKYEFSGSRLPIWAVSTGSFSGSSGGRAEPTTIFFSLPYPPTRHSCNCAERFHQAFQNFFFDSSSRWREASFWSFFGNRHWSIHLQEMGLNSFEAK